VISIVAVLTLAAGSTFLWLRAAQLAIAKAKAIVTVEIEKKDLRIGTS
jgi:hypothetical protein